MNPDLVIAESGFIFVKNIYMGLIINIETATTVCSVNLAKDGVIISERESREDKSHASLLTVFIEQLLNEQKLQVSELDAIAVSKGPGSYTGLRIGVSAAKGLCYGGDVPLISINTLYSLASFANNNRIEKAFNKYYLCPMIDARRMEVYTAIYDQSMNEIKSTSAEIIDEHSFAEILGNNQVYFFGNGADKCRETITHKNAHFISDIESTAQGMVNQTEQAFNNKQFEDLAYFEPYYLKDFVATTPKKPLF